ncbi:tautomerase family protein [Pseudomonas sp. NPDC088368]|uniref:tautomerase family protein n=1 Tax=Pseudomonas sp. NPDC088368 TaxID=3364453 RepID=UPI003821DDA9
MPVIRIDILEGHSDDYVHQLLEGVHVAMVDAFEVPVRDRYQVLSEHKPGRLVMEDTGLNIPRTAKQTLISISSRGRTESAKVKFYRRVCEELLARCSIEPSDVMVSITQIRMRTGASAGDGLSF